MVKLGNPKNAFWEALLLTIVIFIIGLLLGTMFEANKLNEINEDYTRSEIFMMDFLVLNNLQDFEGASCETLTSSAVDFANKIYDEAMLLEKYEEAGKVSENLKLAHWKYDILRTFLWEHVKKIRKECPEFNYIIYLYEFEDEDLVKKAINRVWSNILYDVKQEKGDSLILIPIAVDGGLTSLDLIIDKYNISKFPAVIINDEEVIADLSYSEDIIKYLK
jgi:hypothetical protein